MSESGDPGYEPEQDAQDAFSDERYERDLRAMSSRAAWMRSLPSGCLVSVLVLSFVFVLIMGICSRV